MPFWVSTNTPGNGMDAPTAWRLRSFLILPQGRLNIIDFLFTVELPIQVVGASNLAVSGQVGNALTLWEMVLGGTGYSGAFGRQVTLDEAAERP